MLGGEIDRPNAVSRSTTAEIEDLRLKLADMATLEKRLQEQLGLMVVLFAEIESLRRQLSERGREAEDARRDSLTPYRM